MQDEVPLAYTFLGKQEHRQFEHTQKDLCKPQETIREY